MEMIKDIIIDFVLFSGIEGFIFCLFFEKIGKCRRFKWYEWFILSVGNCLISKFLPPMIYQIACVLWMSLLLNLFMKINIKKCIKLNIILIGVLYIIEVIYTIIINKIFNFNRFLNMNENNIKIYIMFILLKCIELSLLWIYIKTKKEG